MQHANEHAPMLFNERTFKDLIDEGLEERNRDRAKQKLIQALSILDLAHVPPVTSTHTEDRTQLYLQASEKLAQLFVAEEQFDKAIEVCETILVVDEKWEEAYRLLMYSYYRKNKLSKAFNLYEDCCMRLKKHLNRKPRVATTQMVQMMKEAMTIARQ
ncbi:bacterial transcriptional activator domain-containing protein [Desertibacillus haloalkaliphilus]|uniref:bacterial transcriptional activator domain-containing protein n=1 Tax=Desertibacillus haloalkaliphilus TaxID=1328930 RepID=UPI001FE704EB|nr:bacterial transcriptional activator domain-containing protein [Desertibacillus haloalkaliphilus]